MDDNGTFAAKVSERIMIRDNVYQGIKAWAELLPHLNILA